MQLVSYVWTIVYTALVKRQFFRQTCTGTFCDDPSHMVYICAIQYGNCHPDVVIEYLKCG